MFKEMKGNITIHRTTEYCLVSIYKYVDEPNNRVHALRPLQRQCVLLIQPARFLFLP